MTFQDALVAYKTYARAEGKSPKTVAWVVSSIGYFADFLGSEQQDIGTTTGNDLRRFIIALQGKPKFANHPYNKPQQAKLSAQSIETYCRAIKAFFGFLQREGFIGNNVMAKVKMPKVPETVVPTFSEKEVEKLLAQPDKGSNEGFRDYCLLLTLIDTGIRLSELASLNAVSIDYEQNLLKVMGKGSKERFVPFGRRVAKALMKYQLKCRPEPVGTDNFWLRRDGQPFPNTKAIEFGERFAAFQDARFGICVANGTAALEVALRAAGIEAGDEVVVPAYTWVATALAVVYLNAVPVFIDIDPDTYCMDPDALAAAITDRTKAVIPVHLAMSIADMDRIGQIAEQRGLTVIEDCAHMHGGRWRGTGVGSIGDLGCFSFQSTKVITSGEGGIILTSQAELAQRCQSLVNIGHKKPGYDSFDGRMLGWNYRITEFQAAVLLAQLDRLDDQTRIREENATYLSRRLEEIGGVRPLVRDPRATRLAYYRYLFRYDSEEFRGLPRERFVEALEAEGIPCWWSWYLPVHRSPLFALKASEYPETRRRYGEKYTPEGVSCPVTERAAYREAVCLPHPMLLGEKRDMDDIADAIIKIKTNVNELL